MTEEGRVAVGAPPDYFERVRADASAIWAQLDANPQLAAPWHQLFNQVKSPRHVVSELLQNADDAGATEAAVSIEDGEFVFSHNGADFVESEFASLCRFGYSNKRELHTIGFRGVGFKSTFSLGDEVRLLTPTLSVIFGAKRFTEPTWVPDVQVPKSRTEVRVMIRDSRRRMQLEKNLDEWVASPTSLLFFGSIRSLRVRDTEVRWQSAGQGPVARSAWMSLSTAPNERYLLVRSAEESFPVDALEEIRQERMTTDEQEATFPPCEVELVVGMQGRLFVVLPTGVKTQLPFACNAPFVQDPARLKIKEPESSPTNRWLLKRVGELAAEAILGWVSNSTLTANAKCEAYALLPNIGDQDGSIESVCATEVMDALKSSLLPEPFLLAEDGSLASIGAARAVPPCLLDIWSPSDVKRYFLGDGHSSLSRHVAEERVGTMERLGFIDRLAGEEIVKVLASERLARPQTWSQLLLLWEFVAPHIFDRWYGSYRRGALKIVPVQGKDVLYSGAEVIRMGKDRLLRSQSDWEFLARYLLVVNQNWPRFLGEQHLDAEQSGNEDALERIDTAYKVLAAIGLEQPTSATDVIDRVARQVFAEAGVARDDCVRLAQIAAALGATVGPDFQYVTCNRQHTVVADEVLVDLGGDLDLYVDQSWYDEHALHSDYYRPAAACTDEEWRSWVSSTRSGLLGFPSLARGVHPCRGRAEVRELLRQRGVSHVSYYPYVTNDFELNDWDFEGRHWQHWRVMAEANDAFWAAVCSRIMRQPRQFWEGALSAEVVQVSTSHSTKSLTSDYVVPAWILQLRALPCLQDTHGILHQPAELLRRTGDTEMLLDVEPFVRADIDNESTRPLLDVLGVRDTPTGPDGLLERLRALAMAAQPPVPEVTKWYHRLGQLLERCDEEEAREVKDAFRKEKLVLTAECSWATVAEVFVNADEEDAPGVAVVHPACRSLSLWQKVEVAEHPTADLAIAWLQTLADGDPLAADEIKRVRALSARYPFRVWEECGHWLNLEGCWRRVAELSYSVAMNSLVPWKHLFQSVKDQTADFQKLPFDVLAQPPFSTLPSLGSRIEERPVDKIRGKSDPEQRPWLTALGDCLCRVNTADPAETEALHDIGTRMKQTSRQAAEALEVVPYLRNQPAGEARCVDVAWVDLTLFVCGTSVAKMAGPVSAEVGRVFGRPDLIDAVKICYERSADFVTEYMQQNFALAEDAPEGEVEGSGEGEAETPVETRGEGESTSGGGEVVAGGRRDDGGDTSGGSEQTTTEGPEDRDSHESGEHIRSPRPHGPGVMEIYATSLGYQKAGGDGFVRQDGHSIRRASDSMFHWELLSPQGDCVRRYWVKNHCLERDPLEIDSDVWTYCDNNPDECSLILAASDGTSVEYPGRRLLELVESKQLTLHSAKYRLVLGRQ